MLNSNQASPEAESAILGTLLVNPEHMPYALDNLTPNCFSTNRNRILWEALTAVYQIHCTLDTVVVADYLRSLNLASENGSYCLLDELLEELQALKGAAANIVEMKTYCNILDDKNTLRQLQIAGERITALASGSVAGEAVEQAQAEILKLTGTQKDEFDFDRDAVIDTAFHSLELGILDPDRMEGIPSGFTNLDRITKGFRNGELSIIAGRPAMGKTALALNITLNALKSGKRIVLFSLEMSAEELVKRLIKIESGTDFNVAEMGEAATRLKKLPLQIYDANPLTPFKMQQRIRQLQLKGQTPDLVIVDHLQLVDPDDKDNNPVSRMTQITRAMKSNAMVAGVPVIALSQLSRAVEQRQDKRPLMSDLRESGAIEQDAALVVLMYREDYYKKGSASKGAVELIVAKNRYGAESTIELLFRRNLSWFTEPNNLAFLPKPVQHK